MLGSRRQGLGKWDDTDLFPFGIDQTNFPGPDVSIDPGLVRARRNNLSQKSYTCTS